MDMKRWYIILLSAVLILVLALPAFATDTSSSEEGTSISESSEGSEELETVNISDESVSAIANAVSTYNYTVTNKSGLTIGVPDEIVQVWNWMPTNLSIGQRHLAFVADDGYVDWVSCNYISNDDTYWYVTNSYGWYYDGSEGHIIEYDYWQKLLQFPDYNVLDMMSLSGSIADILWYDSYMYSGSTCLYEPDGSDPTVNFFNLSFVSGFDDLVIEDCKSTQFLSMDDPEYEGYQFVGWYYDEDFTSRCNPGDVFTADTTLYAKWVDTGMAFFADSVFGSFTTLFSSEPVLYLLSLMGLALIIGILKSWFDARC